MPVLSGRSGSVLIGSSTLLEFTDGNLNYGSDPQEYFAVSGAGAAETVQGADSGSGTINLVVRSDNFLTANSVTSGSLVSMTWTYTDGTTASGSARLGKFDWSMNRDGTVQRATIPFVTHGSWTFPS